MPTANAVMDSLRLQVSNQISGLSFGAQGGPMVAIGWPPVSVLQQVVAQKGAVISIYDRAGGKNSTRWMPYPTSEVAQAPKITSSMAAGFMPGLANAFLLTVGGAIQANDAVTCSLSLTPNVGVRSMGGAFSSAGAAYVVTATDTIATVCSGLAAAIAADPVMSPFLFNVVASSFTVSGSNNTSAPLYATSAFGSITQQQVEFRRTRRSLQVTCWTALDGDREALTDPLDAFFAQTQAKFGFTVGASADQVRFEYTSDVYSNDDELRDLYRRDFFVEVEYGTSVQQTAYSILVAAQQMSVTTDQTTTVVT